MTDNKIPTCGDCTHADVCARIPYYTEFSRENPAYCKDFEQKQKWIPVTERLPEYGQEVIIYTGNILKPTVLAYQFWNPKYDTWAHVTHWMPLPNPPQEVSDGQT